MTNHFMDGVDIDAVYDKEGEKPYKYKKQHRTTGYCLSCNAALQDSAFCDNWCREDYEFEREMRKRIVGKSRR